MANKYLGNKKQKSGNNSKVIKSGFNFPLEKNNLLILGLGVFIILVGYLLMATGITNEPALPSAKWNNFWAVNVAPLMLLLGYCVIIPYGILKTFKNKTKKAE